MDRDHTVVLIANHLADGQDETAGASREKKPIAKKSREDSTLGGKLSDGDPYGDTRIEVSATSPNHSDPGAHLERRDRGVEAKKYVGSFAF